MAAEGSTEKVSDASAAVEEVAVTSAELSVSAAGHPVLFRLTNTLPDALRRLVVA